MASDDGGPIDPDAEARTLEARIFVLQTGLRVSLGVLGLIAVWLTFRRVRATEVQARVAESGDQTDRYAKAIEQMGDDNLAIRIGGVFALEAVAHDAIERFGDTVRDVLCAYVRLPRTDDADDKTQPDRVAALQALGRIPRQAKLEDLKAPRSDLRHADLRGALLGGADLTRAVLDRANLSGAVIHHANLSGAILPRANLTGTDLAVTSLSGANLTKANLTGANLTKANLTDANLTGANLTDADLRDASWNGKTRWPDDFAPPTKQDDDGADS